MRKEGVASSREQVGRVRAQPLQEIHVSTELPSIWSQGRAAFPARPAEPTLVGIQRQGVCRWAALSTQLQDTIFDAKWRICCSWYSTVAPDLRVANEAFVQAPDVELVDQDERSVRPLHAASKLGGPLLEPPRPRAFRATRLCEQSDVPQGISVSLML